MGITKVICLKIDTFRRFHDITIPFSDRITLIAGQNGTAKSTLLGMLAQPFSFGVVRGKVAGQQDASSYTNNYHGLELHEYKDLAGKSFMYNCDHVFRLSKEFDFGKDYQYRTKLSLPEGGGGNLTDNELHTVSRNQISKKDGSVVRMRFVTGPGTSHKPGEGNFPHPVTYLGLNRLWPLAVAKTCKFSGDHLSNEDRRWYVEKYNEILCLDENDNQAKFIDTVEKRKFITPESSDYDGESCSAGQDNLSQLLTAILSFRHLKKKLKNRYQGGMILIDELDATLHAKAQEKLLELLCDVQDELDFQIVATTHSLHMLELAYQSKLKKNTKVLYLINEDGHVAIQDYSSYQEIRDNLKVQATPPSNPRPSKVSVIFEDKEGEFLFKQICGSKLRKYVQCANESSLGAGQLKNLADMSKALLELKNVIFVPDGDMAKSWPTPPRNLLFLPGDKRPETLIYQLLFDMNDSDPFWKKIGVTYTRQFAIISKGGKSRRTGDSKKWVKKWYKEQSQHWGRGNQKVFKAWVQAHKRECLIFCQKFIKLLRGRYRGEIPKEVIDRTLAVFM